MRGNLTPQALYHIYIAYSRHGPPQTDYLQHRLMKVGLVSNELKD